MIFGLKKFSLNPLIVLLQVTGTLLTGDYTVLPNRKADSCERQKANEFSLIYRYSLNKKAKLLFGTAPFVFPGTNFRG